MASFFSPTNIKNEKKKKKKKDFLLELQQMWNTGKSLLPTHMKKGRRCGKSKNPTVCVNKDRKNTIKYTKYRTKKKEKRDL